MIFRLRQRLAGEEAVRRTEQTTTAQQRGGGGVSGVRGCGALSSCHLARAIDRAGRAKKATLFRTFSDYLFTY